MLWIGGIAMARQQIGQTAGFPPAHGVWLTGQGERSCSRPANLTGGQVKVDQRAVFRAAGGGLVQAHAPQRQEARRSADPLRALLQLLDADAAQLRNHLRGVVADQRFKFAEAFGVHLDEIAIDPVFPQQQVQNPMEQGDIGTRKNRQMQVSQIAGVSTTRVNDDDFHLRTTGFGFLQPTKKYRMGVGHVTADDHHAVAQFQIFVTAWRGVSAEATFVADHRRGHAQPRIAVDIVGTDQRPRQFVEGVVILGEQLPGNVERYAVRAVFGDGFGKDVGGVLQCAVPASTAARQAFAQTQFRVQGAGGEVAGQVQRRAFAAQFAEVGRVRRIAADAEDALAVMLDQYAAADPAVTAGRGGRLAVHQTASRRASCTRPFSTRAGW